MCADCRVVDMMNAKDESTIHRLPQMSDAVAMQFMPPVSPEDQARADLYGLLARLFYAPPDANLISELRLAVPPPDDGEPLTAEGDALRAAWAGLAEACVSAFPARLEEEHLQLFVGVGKAEVTPYLSAYLVRSESDNPLARLRGQLAEWGLARREEAVEPEDHVSALCETMRWLIVGRKASARSAAAVLRGLLARRRFAFLQCGKRLRQREVLPSSGESAASPAGRRAQGFRHRLTASAERHSHRGSFAGWHVGRRSRFRCYAH